MNLNFIKLVAKFQEINEKGYIKGVNNLTNAGGLTFENLIGKKADSKYLPDYHNIEIKTTLRFSRYSIGLFSLRFDEPDKYESNYLLEKYGIKNNDFDKKELIVKLVPKEKIKINDYYFELGINYSSQKLLINIFDSNFNYIETRGFINFNSLKNRIDTKIKNLALIFASKKIINNDLYFRYYKIVCYKIKDFNTFLNLIETHDITLTLMLRFAKSGIDITKNKNKNIMFHIKKQSIDKLFDELYSYEN
jgi:hypothetical protein